VANAQNVNLPIGTTSVDTEKHEVPSPPTIARDMQGEQVSSNLRSSLDPGLFRASNQCLDGGRKSLRIDARLNVSKLFESLQQDGFKSASAVPASLTVHVPASALM